MAHWLQRTVVKQQKVTCVTSALCPDDKMVPLTVSVLHVLL